MLSTRWIKLLRDIETTPWRIAVMLLTIAAGIFGFALMLSSYALLNREVHNNYLATNPASATLEVDNIDATLLAGVRHFPGIALAQAGATINADIYSPTGENHPLKIFVIEDFNQLQINKVFADKGAWPPYGGSLLLERNSLTQLQEQTNTSIKIGDNLQIRWDDGRISPVILSGTVHAPAMPVPSMVNFAYASPDSLKSFGVNIPLTELKITVSNNAFDSNAIEQTASELAAWIQTQGHKVTRIRIPPPGEHPHLKIMFAVLGVFLMFSVIALVLSAVLTATIIDGLMAQQVKQIGVMKTIGASGTQIVGLYLTFVFILSALATALAMPAGLSAGLALSKVILANLNFELQSSALPHNIYVALIAAGVLLPLLMTTIPIIKATRASAQHALNNIGTSRQDYAATTFFSGLTGIDRSLIMALRNTFRRRGRLALILALLASAGAMFMSNLNLKKASQQHLIAAAAERHYDLEISLSRAEDQQKIRAIIQAVDGVNFVEAWSSTTLGRHRADGLNIEKTYSDGGHGALYLTAVPDGSSLLSIKMQRGYWLSVANSNTNKNVNENGNNINENDTVVLNQQALDIFPHAKVGDQITLGAAGNSQSLRIVGIAAQKMTSGTAYVSTATYQKITGQDERYKNYRIVMKQHDDIFIKAVTKKIEAALTQHQLKVNYSLTETKLRHEIDAHFTLLIKALFYIAILMGLVGVFGLASVLSTHITERTREFGIMRSIGASSFIIVRNIILESFFISLMSWMIAIALSLPLSTATSKFLGELIFDEAFPLALSLMAQWVWLLIVVTGAILASLYPAKKAARLNIRESFAM